MHGPMNVKFNFMTFDYPDCYSFSCFLKSWQALELRNPHS